MLITSLILENIKSYAREEIHLTEGLNAICGHNGSGKTTVLEAIGHALFDFLPYNQAAFLREGQKSGTVRVRIVPSDGREYEVVRKVGSGATWYVSDVETGMRIVERGEAVLDWIRGNALGIDGETDLEAVFKNAVGVPQGLMTADFQNKPVARKAVFDPLLRVEEYRDAYESLRETRSYLVGLLATINEAMARLEAETETIAPLRAEIAGLQADLEVSERRLGSLAEELESSDEERRGLEDVQMALVSLRQELMERNTEVARHEATLVEHDKAVEAAQAARVTAIEAEPGYRAVIAARERLSALQKLREERDHLDAEIGQVTERMTGIQRSIDRLDAEANDAREKAEQAAAMSRDVERQDELDGKLREATIRLQAEKPLQIRKATLDSELHDIDHEITRLETAIDGAEVARNEAQRLPVVQQELRALADEQAGFASKRQRMIALEPEGRTLRLEHDRLVADVKRLGDLRRKVAEVAPAAAPLDGLLQQVQARREERIEMRAAIEYQTVARSALERRHCPLLDLQCPAVSAQPVLLEGFDRRAVALSEQLPALDAHVERLETNLAAARGASEQLQKLRLEVAQLTGSEEQLLALTERLVHCREEYATLQEAVKGATALDQRHQELATEETRLQSAAGRAGEVEFLPKQLKRERAAQGSRREELAVVRKGVEALEAVQAEIRKLQETVSRLGDPRGRQQNLLATAGRGPEIRCQVEGEQQRLKEAADRLRAVVALKLRFESLDRDLATQQAIERDNSADHELYLKYREEAGTLEARELLAAQTRTLHNQALDASRDRRHRLEATERRYDATKHATLNSRCDELGKAIAAESTNRDHLERDLDINREHLAYLERQEVKLSTHRCEREEVERTQEVLGYVRDTIKAAGPAITEQLLRNISQVANDFFAEIMDDHAAELRWDREYEVLVQRGTETRNFAQLSGGEQMSAALAVRLALLKEMSEVDVAFFDEPTQNMDQERRDNLAGQIRQVRGFRQLIVISHDDTFEHDTDNLIRLRKVDGESRVVA